MCTVSLSHTHEADHAAANGHLETVKWLHENRTEGCTRYAMTDAAGNGHLETVQWLHRNRDEGCGRGAMVRSGAIADDSVCLTILSNDKG